MSRAADDSGGRRPRKVLDRGTVKTVKCLGALETARRSALDSLRQSNKRAAVELSTCERILSVWERNAARYARLARLDEATLASQVALIRGGLSKTAVVPGRMTDAQLMGVVTKVLGQAFAARVAGSQHASFEKILRRRNLLNLRLFETRLQF